MSRFGIRRYYKVLRQLNGEAEQIQRWLEGAFAKTAVRCGQVLRRRLDLPGSERFFEEIRFECYRGKFVLSGTTQECLVNIYILSEKKEQGEAFSVSITHDLPPGSEAAFKIEELVRQHKFVIHPNMAEGRPYGQKIFCDYWDRLIEPHVFPQPEWFNYSRESK